MCGRLFVISSLCLRECVYACVAPPDQGGFVLASGDDGREGQSKRPWKSCKYRKAENTMGLPDEFEKRLYLLVCIPKTSAGPFVLLGPSAVLQSLTLGVFLLELITVVGLGLAVWVRRVVWSGVGERWMLYLFCHRSLVQEGVSPKKHEQAAEQHRERHLPVLCMILRSMF